MSPPKSIPTTIAGMQDDAALYFAKHPPDLEDSLGAGAYNPTRGLWKGYGSSDSETLSDAVACPYCRKNINDCRCNVT